MRRLLLSIPLACWAALAQAQSVQQSGVVTPGHPAVWVSSGVVKDGGAATAGNLTNLGIYANGGLPDCITAAAVGRSSFNPASTPYNQMCFSLGLNNAARIDVNSYNGAASVPFVIALNGLPVFTSGSTPPQIPTIDVVSSGATATPAAVFDITVAWNSATASAKTTTIAACAPALVGFKVTVKDELGTANVYAITTSPAAGTIDGKSSYIETFALQSVTLQCDGVNNWMVI